MGQEAGYFPRFNTKRKTNHVNWIDSIGNTIVSSPAAEGEQRPLLAGEEPNTTGI
jgi:hypothetical protein